MADNRYDEAIDIVARHVSNRWFLNETLPGDANQLIRKRVRELLPPRPSADEFSAAWQYLRFNNNNPKDTDPQLEADRRDDLTRDALNPDDLDIEKDYAIEADR